MLSAAKKANKGSRRNREIVSKIVQLAGAMLHKAAAVFFMGMKLAGKMGLRISSLNGSLRSVCLSPIMGPHFNGAHPPFVPWSEKAGGEKAAKAQRIRQRSCVYSTGYTRVASPFTPTFLICRPFFGCLRAFLAGPCVSR